MLQLFYTKSLYKKVYTKSLYKKVYTKNLYKKFIQMDYVLTPHIAVVDGLHSH